MNAREAADQATASLRTRRPGAHSKEARRSAVDVQEKGHDEWD